MFDKYNFSILLLIFFCVILMIIYKSDNLIKFVIENFESQNKI